MLELKVNHVSKRVPGEEIYSTSQEICTWFRLFCVFLWFGSGKFYQYCSIVQGYHAGTWTIMLLPPVARMLLPPMKEPWMILVNGSHKSCENNSKTRLCKTHLNPEHIFVGYCVYGLRDHAEYELSQWMTMLQCTIISHWLSPYPE